MKTQKSTINHSFFRSAAFAIAAFVALFGASASTSAQTNGESGKAQTPAITVLITEQGFEAGAGKLKKGVPAQVTFLRKTDATCAKQVAINGVKKDLPLNQPVTVTFTPKKSGELVYWCGMNMLRGTLVVE